MKKLIQISLIIIVVLALVPAVAGGVPLSADKMVSHQNLQFVTAPVSAAGIQVLICAGSRPTNCMTPNVGWNT